MSAIFFLLSLAFTLTKMAAAIPANNLAGDVLSDLRDAGRGAADIAGGMATVVGIAKDLTFALLKDFIVSSLPRGLRAIGIEKPEKESKSNLTDEYGRVLWKTEFIAVGPPVEHDEVKELRGDVRGSRSMSGYEGKALADNELVPPPALAPRAPAVGIVVREEEVKTTTRKETFDMV